MKTVNSLIARFQVLAQIFLLLCYCTGTPALSAASSMDLDYTDLNQLAQLETTIYGFAHKNLPNEKRVDSLEKILFGKTHSGPLHSRIVSIASTLTGSPSNSLSPPIAPSLDRPDALKGEAPDIAPESGGEKGEDEIQPPAEAKHDRINNALQQAMQLYSQGKTSQAEAIFKNVLSLDDKNADANYNLGAIAESRGDWQKALHYYQVAQIGNPGDTDIQNAIESMKAKITANAQEAKASKKTNLSNKEIDSLKAKVDEAGNDYAKGDFDSAIANLKAVLAQAPDQADLYYALGQAYKAKKQNSDAINAFTQAVKFAPDNKQYADALAELNNNQGKENSVSHHNADTFSNDNPNADKTQGQSKLAQGKLANQNNSDWEPETPGEITPFSDQGSNNELGWQPAGAAYGSNYYAPGGMNSAYMPGYTYSNYIPYSMTTMIERAAMGSLAGAAIGSMLSPPGYRSRGAFTGGMVGGMMGFMGGRHR